MAVILVGSIYFLDVIHGLFFRKHMSSKTSIFDIFQICLGEAWIGREHVPTPYGSLSTLLNLPNGHIEHFFSLLTNIYIYIYLYGYPYISL